ncbi:MAG: ABC transporter permease subunit [Pseudolabrys sp.]
MFGLYYAPYVYMFTASALRNMDPSLEEAAEISGASAFGTLFSVTFPLIMPAIVSGMLLVVHRDARQSMAFRRCSARRPTSPFSPPTSSN